MSDTSTMQPLVWLLMWHGASGSCCNLPGLFRRGICLLNCFERGFLLHGSAETVARRGLEMKEPWVPAATWLLVHPAVPVGGSLQSLALHCHACKRNLVPCTSALEQRASPCWGYLPAAPGSEFLPDRPGSVVVARQLDDKLTAFYLCREML